MVVIHVSGSWFEKESARAFLAELRANNYEIAVDWTTDDYERLSKFPDQFDLVFKTGIELCDVLFISFCDMQQRTHAATFHLYAIAVATGKKIVVFDPDMTTRLDRFHGHPVHPAFHDLMGWSFINCPNVSWVATHDKALVAIKRFTPWA